MFKSEVYTVMVTDMFEKQARILNIDKNFKVKFRKNKNSLLGVRPYGKTVRIYVSMDFIEQTTKEELEAAIAHEMWHILHHKFDMYVRSPLRLIKRFNELLLYTGLFKFAFDNSVLDICFEVSLSVLVASLIISIPVNYLTRRNELKADLYGISLIGKNTSTIKLMQKFAHMDSFLRNPLKKLLYTTMVGGTHPTIKQRIKNLEYNVNA